MIKNPRRNYNWEKEIKIEMGSQIEARGVTNSGRF